jgi:hypothetical protein
MPALRLPSRALVLKILGGVVLALILIVAIPPVRKAFALGTSKAVLFVAAPLAPDIADFKQLPQTTKLVAVDGSTVAELDKSERRVPIKLDQLPDHVKQAVMGAEDQDFYQHSGVDPTAVFRAFLRSAQGRTQGGSTITQQLAKINYTARERTVGRKLKEVLYATRLEEKYSKDQLMERYLNQVYFGQGAYGINAAAEVYYGTTADKLTVDQAALIAGKIRAPEALDPRDPKDVPATKRRRDQVLRNMRQEGWLKKADYDKAVAAPVALPIDASPIVTTGRSAVEPWSLLAIANTLLPFRIDVDCTLRTWVSVTPHTKQVTWRAAGRLVHGVSGPIASGRSVPSTSCSSPGRCHANRGSRASATSTCGQNSWKCESPPLPHASATRRLVRRSPAANATPLPAVRSRTSQIRLRETPSAAPAARLHLSSARRLSACCSSRREGAARGGAGRGGAARGRKVRAMVTRRYTMRRAAPRRPGACRPRASSRARWWRCTDRRGPAAPARRSGT